MADHQVERICPSCRAAQSLAAHYCATCGAALERLVPMQSNQWLPAVVRQQLRHPLVRGAAMGAMAVVVEVAVVLIRRALSHQVAQQLTTRSDASLPTARQSPDAPTTSRRTTVTARRRTWFWRDKNGNTRSDEQLEWRRVDE
ncbi:MAG: hypothetical protein EBS29_02545 [Chloroflexia bacterium]|nr:hypothetical protein [Chloroflexia bacterium]